MKVLAIIPARGGSKGIINKNIQKIGGLPLIKHTIISAKKSKKIDKILISTDDRKILKISSSMGVEAPFLRPKKISSHTATSTSTPVFFFHWSSHSGTLRQVYIS